MLNLFKSTDEDGYLSVRWPGCSVSLFCSLAFFHFDEVSIAFEERIY
jgi:hypothetical protein